MKYAEKINVSRATYLNAGMQIGAQMMADFIAIALNDPNVLGKSILGANRLKLVFRRVNELDRLFEDAFTTGPEADYCQEKLDQRLAQIYGSEGFVPFAERYPNIKQRKWV